jgi:hypothetical protein
VPLLPINLFTNDDLPILSCPTTTIFNAGSSLCGGGDVRCDDDVVVAGSVVHVTIVMLSLFSPEDAAVAVAATTASPCCSGRAPDASHPAAAAAAEVTPSPVAFVIVGIDLDLVMIVIVVHKFTNAALYSTTCKCRCCVAVSFALRMNPSSPVQIFPFTFVQFFLVPLVLVWFGFPGSCFHLRSLSFFTILLLLSVDWIWKGSKTPSTQRVELMVRPHLSANRSQWKKQRSTM